MKRWPYLPFVLVAALLACNLSGRPTATPVSPPLTASPTQAPANQTQTPPIVAVTFTASPIPVFRPTNTPVPSPAATDTPLPVPTAVAPISTVFPDVAYVLAEEQAIGSYALRLWEDPASDEFVFDSVATISAVGQPTAQIEFASAFGDLTGTDLTGEGHPDVVIETYTGGAHCCFSTHVYDLGPVMTKMLETPVSNCGGAFEELDGDGVFEFVTCDDSFAYVYCAYAGSPLVKVIYQYEPGRRYVPASPLFADQYIENIAAHREQAEEARPGEMGEWDNTTKCAVLPIVLDYLYAGNADLAWEEFERLYTYPDAADFRAEIEEMVSDSVRFAPPLD